MKGLKLKGKLELGQSLSGSYSFAHNNGDSRDQSQYGWGVKGQATPVQTVTTPGQVPARKLVKEDIGQILEVAVQAQNGAGKTGNTLKLATDADKGQGNEIEGGDKGKPIDPQAKPTVAQLQISGKAEEGQSLSATYQYQSNNSGGQDRSRYAWGVKGTTAGLVKEGGTIGGPGQVPEYKLGDKDVGLVMEVSVRAQNSLGKVGNIATKFMEAKVMPELVPVPNYGDFYLMSGKSDSRKKNWSGANNLCQENGMRLPSRKQIDALRRAYPNNKINTLYGWPIHGDGPGQSFYWTSSTFPDGTYVGEYLSGGSTGYPNDGGQLARVACVR